MATDDEYMAFLEKANRDPNEGFASVQGSGSNSKEFKHMDEDATIPEPIQKVMRGGQQALVYTSDADEPFLPVVLAWHESGNTLPDEGTPFLLFYY
jgi:hypothetical protein